MSTDTVLERLLHHCQRSVILGSPDEILGQSSSLALELTGARLAFASYVPPGQPWQRGVHIVQDGQPGPVSEAARSAMFALHRRLADRREPLTLELPEAGAALFAGLGIAAGAAIHAVPIIHRTGRVWGDLALVFDAAPHLPAETAAALVELARSTTAALENAQRLGFARRDQDRLLLLAEAAEEALWDWNLDTREFWWGGGIQNLLGSGGDTAQNNARWKLERVHPDDVAGVEASLERARASADSLWKHQYRFRRADGTWMHVEDCGYFLRDASGRAYRIIGAMRDVTQVHEALVREREARADAERANRAKDDFLAMLGHELRNPLAPIITALQLLRARGVQGGDRELTVIERQAQHLIRLVDDLLDVSRISHAKLELRREPLEVASAVAAALEMARPLIEQRRHELHVDVPLAGLEVSADRARLAQAIANLLTNAAKYTEPGGHVFVAAAREGDRVVISVRDTGIGISAEMLPTIFDMFVQERQALDRAHGGLGLGLSIVRGLVHLHGGTVQVRSDGLGRGSEFVIYLPALASSARAASGAAPAPAPAALTGHRVLVVDDNEDAAEMLGELLECLGNEVRVVHDPDLALRLAEGGGPELALLDIGLPGMDGYELAARLRQLPAAAGLRLIAITGYGQEADRARALAAGFDEHLVKPISIDRLEVLIKRLLAPPAP